MVISRESRLNEKKKNQPDPKNQGWPCWFSFRISFWNRYWWNYKLVSSKLVPKRDVENEGLYSILRSSSSKLVPLRVSVFLFSPSLSPSWNPLCSPPFFSSFFQLRTKKRGGERERKRCSSQLPIRLLIWLLIIDASGVLLNRRTRSRPVSGYKLPFRPREPSS